LAASVGVIAASAAVSWALEWKFSAMCTVLESVHGGHRVSGIVSAV
jgi:Flp pilus assembly pilin Flp